MQDFKTTLISSIRALFIGRACAARLAFSTKVVRSNSALKSSGARMSGDDFPLARADRTQGDPDSTASYSPSGITRINGRRIAVYAFPNGSKLCGVAGQGQVNVFDSAGLLIRRFVFRESQLACKSSNSVTHPRAEGNLK